MRAKTATKHVHADQRNLLMTDHIFKKMYRHEALASQRMACTFCRDRITHANATAEHLIPRSAGGRTERKNIKASCEPCNMAKGALTEARFRDILHSPRLPAYQRHAMAWIRFRINRRVEKAERRIRRAVGMESA